MFSPRSSNPSTNATKRRASVANSNIQYERSLPWGKVTTSTENKVSDRKRSIYKTKGSENPAFVLDKGIMQ